MLLKLFVYKMYQLATLTDANVFLEQFSPYNARKLSNHLIKSYLKEFEMTVGIIMGSKSDWPTMKLAADMLDQFGVAYETKVVSAHRTPQLLADYATSAKERGIKVIIAGAGGAAHLPGMAAAFTSVPVLGVPVQSKALKGMDSLLSIVQMPKGIAVGTLAIGEAGAANAGILAAQIIGTHNEDVMAKVEAFRSEQTETVLANPNPAED
ncbi:N5-carboxyaminoimidazole ribonucleotide mutase [Vibrio sp. THAF190c]|nr:N5-carboxyaminoimidazole ribonucleotide mutase [Vibrio sp. THAF190c]